VVFMLAQLYMRKENFAEARQLLGPMTRNSPDPELRQHAQSLMEGITRSEALLAQDRALEKQLAPRLDNSSGQPPRSDGNSVALPDSVQPDWDVLLSQSLRKPHEGEMRVRGILTAIECNAKGMTFKVRAGDRLLQFHSDNFERLAIIAFTNEVPREIVCGPRRPENAVVMTYAAARTGSKADGEASAIEFVPGNFVLKQ